MQCRERLKTDGKPSTWFSPGTCRAKRRAYNHTTSPHKTMGVTNITNRTIDTLYYTRLVSSLFYSSLLSSPPVLCNSPFFFLHSLWFSSFLFSCSPILMFTWFFWFTIYQTHTKHTQNRFGSGINAFWFCFKKMKKKQLEKMALMVAVGTGSLDKPSPTT